MMSIMSKDGEDEVVDVMRQSHKGESPITYGDAYLDENGRYQPLET